MNEYCTLYNCPCNDVIKSPHNNVVYARCNRTQTEEDFLWDNFGTFCPIKKHPNDKRDFDLIMKNFIEFRDSTKVLEKLRGK